MPYEPFLWGVGGVVFNLLKPGLDACNSGEQFWIEVTVPGVPGILVSHYQRARILKKSISLERLKISCFSLEIFNLMSLRGLGPQRKWLLPTAPRGLHLPEGLLFPPLGRQGPYLNAIHLSYF